MQWSHEWSQNAPLVVVPPPFCLGVQSPPPQGYWRVAWVGGALYKEGNPCRDEIFSSSQCHVQWGMSQKDFVLHQKPVELSVVPTTRWISRYLPIRFVRFVHFKCQFDIFWPVINTSNTVVMAPRNLQSVNGNVPNGNGLLRMTSQEDLVVTPDGSKLCLSRYLLLAF